jgi:hypothetical protein
MDDLPKRVVDRLTLADQEQIASLTQGMVEKALTVFGLTAKR